jgi:ubiquinone biosynthesis protein COQ4
MKMDRSAEAHGDAADVSSGNAVYYLNGRRQIRTDSSVLISSSPWLNDPRIREWVATESLRRNGHDYPLLFGLPQLVRGLDEGRDVERVEALIQEERKRNPKLDAWFEERFISTYTLADLGRNPAGSIGRLLFEHMDGRGLAPELDPRRMENPNWAPKLDIEYYNLRTAQTHDFDHILGEVGFDVVAEIFPTGLRTGNMYAHVTPELAGELLANNTIIMFPWFMRTMLHYPAAWPTMFRNLRHGHDVGEQSDLLFTTKFEDIMHLSPAEARDAIGMRGLMGPTSSEAASLIFGEGRLII